MLPSQDYVTYSEISAGSKASEGYLKLDSKKALQPDIHAQLSSRY